MNRKPSEIPSVEVQRLLERAVGRIAIGKIAMRDAEYSVHPTKGPSEKDASSVRSAARVSFVPVEAENKAGSLVSFKSSFNTTEDGVECSVVVVASFEVQYHVKPELFSDPESLEAFARINGVFLAWSYWREFFMNACGRMGIAYSEMVPLLPSKDAQRIAGYAPDEPSV